jgi:hypothetical protein
MIALYQHNFLIILFLRKICKVIRKEALSFTPKYSSLQERGAIY